MQIQRGLLMSEDFKKYMQQIAAWAEAYDQEVEMSENGLKDVVAALCTWATAVRDEDERAVSWDDFWPIVEYLESYESESAQSAADDEMVICPNAELCGKSDNNGSCPHMCSHKPMAHLCEKSHICPECVPVREPVGKLAQYNAPGYACQHCGALTGCDCIQSAADVCQYCGSEDRCECVTLKPVRCPVRGCGAGFTGICPHYLSHSQITSGNDPCDGGDKGCQPCVVMESAADESEVAPSGMDGLLSYWCGIAHAGAIGLVYHGLPLEWHPAYVAGLNMLQPGHNDVARSITAAWLIKLGLQHMRDQSKTPSTE